jgi:hypothetical protein
MQDNNSQDGSKGRVGKNSKVRKPIHIYNPISNVT